MPNICPIPNDTVYIFIEDSASWQKKEEALRVFTLSQLEFKCRSKAREKNGTCSNSDLRCSHTLETEESFAHLFYLPELGAFSKAGLFSAAYLIVFWPTSLRSCWEMTLLPLSLGGYFTAEYTPLLICPC